MTSSDALDALPAGWTLAASSFNWTPEVIRAERSARDIIAGVAHDGVASVIELEAGQALRSFPDPTPEELDELSGALAAAGGRIGIFGASIDDWNSPTRRRSDDERFEFLLPQLHAASRLGALGLRLPLGQAGPALIERLLPLLHEHDLVLFEEVQGSQTPSSPESAAAYDHLVGLDDPHLRLVLDISMLMPALPVTYLERLTAAGLPQAFLSQLTDRWRDPQTRLAVLALLREGGVPPHLHTLYMDMVVRFGRSDVSELADVLPFVSAVHLKFWDLDDQDGRVSDPLRAVGEALAGVGFTGTLASEWGGHAWLDDDPTAMTRAHLDLARHSLLVGAARASAAPQGAR
ncbi:hypothetical protein GCM10010988_30450 [Cnuibacter physcomitrellae]|uniref:restriction endonuclease subunit R n=1 Tax=Cnuibacter physcomitrellae TaxID=1619308 RepID=UPI0019ACD484|nr:restriction endonuclease subunit R [Cnuibacter physcomitrellae]GGI40710.1 hypothetical protein GCM10010988_30450 [Cnuibacter physcomitrellae]